MVGAVGGNNNMSIMQMSQKINYQQTKLTSGAVTITKDNWQETLRAVGGDDAVLSLTPQQKQELYEKGKLTVQYDSTFQSCGEGALTLMTKGICALFAPAKTVAAIHVDPKFAQMALDPTSTIGFANTYQARGRLTVLPTADTPPTDKKEDPKPVEVPPYEPPVLKRPDNMRFRDFEPNVLAVGDPQIQTDTPIPPPKAKTLFDHHSTNTKDNRVQSTADFFRDRPEQGIKFIVSGGSNVLPINTTDPTKAKNNVDLTIRRVNNNPVLTQFGNVEIDQAAIGDQKHAQQLTSEWGLKPVLSPITLKDKQGKDVQREFVSFEGTADKKGIKPSANFVATANKLLMLKIEEGPNAGKTVLQLRELTPEAKTLIKNLAKENGVPEEKLLAVAESFMDGRNIEVEPQITIENQTQCNEWKAFLASKNPSNLSAEDKKLYDYVASAIKVFETPPTVTNGEQLSQDYSNAFTSLDQTVKALPSGTDNNSTPIWPADPKVDTLEELSAVDSQITNLDGLIKKAEDLQAKYPNLQMDVVVNGKKLDPATPKQLVIELQKKKDELTTKKETVKNFLERLPLGGGNSNTAQSNINSLTENLSDLMPPKGTSEVDSPKEIVDYKNQIASIDRFVGEVKANKLSIPDAGLQMPVIEGGKIKYEGEPPTPKMETVPKKDVLKKLEDLKALYEKQMGDVEKTASQTYMTPDKLVSEQIPGQLKQITANIHTVIGKTNPAPTALEIANAQAGAEKSLDQVTTNMVKYVNSLLPASRQIELSNLDGMDSAGKQAALVRVMQQFDMTVDNTKATGDLQINGQVVAKAEELQRVLHDAVHSIQTTHAALGVMSEGTAITQIQSSIKSSLELADTAIKGLDAELKDDNVGSDRTTNIDTNYDPKTRHFLKDTLANEFNTAMPKEKFVEAMVKLYSNERTPPPTEEQKQKLRADFGKVHDAIRTGQADPPLRIRTFGSGDNATTKAVGAYKLEESGGKDSKYGTIYFSSMNPDSKTIADEFSQYAIDVYKKMPGAEQTLPPLLQNVDVGEMVYKTSLSNSNSLADLRKIKEDVAKEGQALREGSLNVKVEGAKSQFNIEGVQFDAPGTGDGTTQVTNPTTSANGATTTSADATTTQPAAKDLTRDTFIDKYGVSVDQAKGLVGQFKAPLDEAALKAKIDGFLTYPPNANDDQKKSIDAKRTALFEGVKDTVNGVKDKSLIEIADKAVANTLVESYSTHMQTYSQVYSAASDKTHVGAFFEKYGVSPSSAKQMGKEYSNFIGDPADLDAKIAKANPYPPNASEDDKAKINAQRDALKQAILSEGIVQEATDAINKPNADNDFENALYAFMDMIKEFDQVVQNMVDGIKKHWYAHMRKTIQANGADNPASQMMLTVLDLSAKNNFTELFQKSLSNTARNLLNEDILTDFFTPSAKSAGFTLAHRLADVASVDSEKQYNR